MNDCLLKKIGILIVGLFIGASISPVASSMITKKQYLQSNTFEETIHINSNKTIYVDDEGDGDFKHIQKAVNKALPGDTIEVYSGVYNEHIIIKKPIILKGISSELGNGTDIGQPVINGLNFGDVLIIESENCIVTGFKIVNSGRIFTMKNGIKVNANNCKVIGNTLKNNFIGIFMSNKQNCIIRDNIILFNVFGINAGKPINCTICNNSIFNSGLSISATADQVLTNTINNNMVNNKPFYMYINEYNITISNLDAGQVLIIDCHYVIVENLSIQNTSIGLSIEYSSNLTIRNNNFENIHRGGISLHGNNCNVYNNNFRNCSYGCYLEGGNNFYIHHNNFIEVFKHDQPVISWVKKHQTFMESTNITFDQNYWDDWIGFKMSKMQGIPKIIPGYRKYIHKWLNIFPIFEFDWHPAQEPYEIP